VRDAAREPAHHKTCCVEGCASPLLARGMCSKHWQRMYKTGSLERTRPEWASVEERFLSKIAPADGNGCRVWTASRTARGYGNFNIGGRSVGAHRYAWELANGPVVPGHELNHKCNNPPCVTVEHLEQVTHDQNMKYMAICGRAKPLRGEAAPNAKLTEKDIREIRARIARGERQVSVGALYGIHQAVVWKIKERKSWSHVE